MRTCELGLGAGDKGVEFELGEGLEDIFWLDCLFAGQEDAAVCAGGI